MLNLGMLMLYILLNVYAIWHVASWLIHSFPKHSVKRWLAIIAGVLFFVMSSTLLIWLPFSKQNFWITVIRTGNYWLGFFIEFVFCLVVFDFIRGILKLIRKNKAFTKHNLMLLRRRIGYLVFAMAAILTIEGWVSARTISVKQETIHVDKQVADTQKLKVALIADLHLGFSTSYKGMKQMVDEINAQKPDVVVIAGDIFDNNYDAVGDVKKIASAFREISSTYGVFATWGNHDVKATLVGGFTVGKTGKRDPRMSAFLKESNITELKDDKVMLANQSIYLIGREDGEHTGNQKKRKSLKALMKNVDTKKPVFVINHEPVDLSSYADNNVDVLFSGHTHNGQFFPLNLMNGFVWKNASGCEKIGNMYSFVTSGIGVYGPHMRTFTRPEVMMVTIHFNS